MAYTTIDKPEDHFNIVTYTGNNTNNRSITGLGFQPDLTWIKQRVTQVSDHCLFDSTRGSNKKLCSNSAATEVSPTLYGGVGSFDSDGFTLVNGTTEVLSSYMFEVNKTSETYVAWNWKANGGTTSSNTNGTITSTVQANTTAGFSIVTWTGSGSAGTIGHGLGAVPTHFIVKERNGVDDWANYSPFLDGLNYVFSLNNTYSQFTPASYINSTAPTSSVFSVDGSIINQSGQTYVGYFFTDIQGYSKMGKYTGNGNTNGTFVYTGFKPAFILIKNLDATENWFIMDNKRDGYNLTNKYILASNATTESANSGYGNIDLLSNGFKLRSSYQSVNSTHEFAYLAFAENPFVTSTGIPATAR